MKQMEKGVQEYSKDESPDIYDTTSTCISRQFSFEKSAKSTRIYQFNGDKTGNKKTSSLLIMTVLKSFLPKIACRTKTTGF